MLNSLVSIILSVLILIFVYKVDSNKLFSIDPFEGAFGLLSQEQILITVFLGPLSFICLGGYTLALNYFPPHIVANAFVLEPFLSQILAIVSGQDEIPGILTFVGGAIAISAIIVIAKGSHDLVKSNNN